MGYRFGTNSIWARPAGAKTAWVRLAPNSLAFPVLGRGLGPTPANRILLAPGESYLSRDNTLRPPPEIAANFAQSSFASALYHFAWPAEWHGRVEYKVGQRLPNFGSDSKLWAGTLESGVVETDVEEIRRVTAETLKWKAKLQAEFEARIKAKTAPKEVAKAMGQTK